MKIVLIFLFLSLLLYLLWINGYLVINTKRALFYLDFKGKHPDSRKITVSSCTGATKRTLNLSKNQLYKFRLSSSISNGAIRAEIQNKDILLTLDENYPTQFLSTAEISRYYLFFRFQKADGTVCLEWKQV